MADLTTLANVKLYLSITVTTKDSLISALITRMSGFVERFCNRLFILADHTDFYDGKENNGGVLRLNQYPVNSITSVHDDTDRAYGAATLIPADDYVFEEDYGVVKRTDDTEFDDGRHNIKVIYNAGWLLTDLPGDLEQAVIELVANKLNLAGRSHLKAERLSKWGATYGEPTPLPASTREVLLQYKKRNFDVI